LRSRALVVTTALLLLSAAPARADVTVTSAADSGPGTLRQLVASSVDGQTIDVPDPRTLAVPASSYVLTSGPVVISKSVLLKGAGAGVVTVDAQHHSRVFTITAPGNPNTGGRVEAMTITGGIGTGAPLDGAGGGVYVAPGAHGALIDTVVTANSVNAANAFGGGVAVDTGGGLDVSGQVTANSATGLNAQGGGIAAQGAAVIDIANATVDHNTVSASGGVAAGGGISSVDGPATCVLATIESSTFASNSVTSTATATLGGGNVAARGAGVLCLRRTTVAYGLATTNGHGGGASGGNLYNAIFNANTPQTQLEQTLVTGGSADSSSTDDCGGSNSTIVDDTIGHNLISTRGLVCPANAALGDKSGAAGLDTTLRDNGGGQPTLELRAGSPAVDGGVHEGASGCLSVQDQRGFQFFYIAATPLEERTCDIGAFEQFPMVGISDPPDGFPTPPPASSATVAGQETIYGYVYPDGLAATLHATVTSSLTGTTHVVSAPDVAIPAGQGPQLVPLTVNVDANDTYTYRLTLATAVSSRMDQPDRALSFRMATAPAAASWEMGTNAEAATDITATSAHLHGFVFPRGLDTAWHFTLTPQGGKPITVPGATVPAAQLYNQVPVDAVATGLTPDTLYTVKMVATNARGGNPDNANDGQLDAEFFRTLQAPVTHPLRISHLSVSPSRVRHGHSAKVTVSVSGGPADVKLTLQRRATGARVKGHCGARPRHGHLRSCTRYVAVSGSITKTGVSSSRVKITLGPKFAGHTLSRGTYRLAAVATKAGHHSSAVHVTFTVH
jgi:hypothetical protein